MPRTEKQRIGALGEDIGCRYLEEHGFRIIGRNYRKKWGEIDIIARKDSVIHFVEVKSVVSAVSFRDGEDSEDPTEKRPEENVHPWKLKRLGRAIRSYLLEKSGFSYETDWRFDVMAVFIDEKTRRARVRVLENVIIEE